MVKVIGPLKQYPARVSAIWYMGTIFVGAILLLLPISRHPDREPISLLDAAFTSTSAVCVTGLGVRSTGDDFSWFGQCVILLLMQIGGIGIMTFTTSITFWLSGHQSLRGRVVLANSLGAESEPDLSWILRRVIFYTICVEGLGFILLTLRFLFDHSVDTAIWHALFHSISAYCNAGFSLYGDSMVRYQADWIVNLTVVMLIVVGGIGFPVMLDVTRNWKGVWWDRWDQLMLHSKLVLTGTISMIVIGTTAILMLEWSNTLAAMPVPGKVLAALFHSVTCRTAGFNSVDVMSLTNATLFVSIILMGIGAAPCSTAGGVKITTISVLLLRGLATLRGRQRILIWRRTVPRVVSDRSITTVILFATVAAVALTVLLLVEQSVEEHARSRGLFLDATFEVISALATVGLSTGMTPHLSVPGQIVIIILMFTGRIGPISLFAALSRSEQAAPFEYAEEEPLIG